MQDRNQGKPERKLPPVKRKPVALSSDEWFGERQLFPGESLPLVLEPRVEGVDLVGCVSGRRGRIEGLLHRHGAILFRGFKVSSADALEQFIAATSADWAEYREAATPRTQVSEHVHTSTDYPADQHIFLHNENSHCESWPLKIYFLCLTPAAGGGETPVADCRAVYRGLDPRIVERFERKGVLYVRNFGRLGFSWRQVFKTGDRSEVEAYCRNAGMEFEWRDADRLRIRYVREASALHPVTRERVWFNHATFFNQGNLDSRMREELLAEFSEDELPYDTFYGDGTPIEPSVIDELREAYRRHTVAFPWEAGDLLMADNMLVAHGRHPFLGRRQVLVGMAEPYGHALTRAAQNA